MGMPLGATVNGRYAPAYACVHSDKVTICLTAADDADSRTEYFVSCSSQGSSHPRFASKIIWNVLWSVTSISVMPVSASYFWFMTVTASVSGSKPQICCTTALRNSGHLVNAQDILSVMSFSFSPRSWKMLCTSRPYDSSVAISASYSPSARRASILSRMG